MFHVMCSSLRWSVWCSIWFMMHEIIDLVMLALLLEGLSVLLCVHVCWCMAEYKYCRLWSVAWDLSCRVQANNMWHGRVRICQQLLHGHCEVLFAIVEQLMCNAFLERLICLTWLWLWLWLYVACNLCLMKYLTELKQHFDDCTRDYTWCLIA